MARRYRSTITYAVVRTRVFRAFAVDFLRTLAALYVAAALRNHSSSGGRIGLPSRSESVLLP